MQFDCVVAAWVLHHVQDLHGTLLELRRVLRPSGRLVAVTNSERTLPELWGLFGDAWTPSNGFSAESGALPLLRHFTLVERRDVRGTVTFPDRDATRRYVAASPVRAHLADRLPSFEGPLQASRHVAVFVCEP
jgi:SAM-dependent methyltransferase